jgi:nicotinamidase-related amidase
VCNNNPQEEKAMSMKIDLVLIDFQVDFCTPTKQGGKLYVPGAEEDVNRVTAMINRIGSRLNDIHATLDSHHQIHIAHPLYWKDSKGRNPDPFTLISVADVEQGKWTTTSPGLYKRSLEYVKSLEKNGRYVLCVWPPHCLIGTPGHNIAQPLLDALLKWESDNFAIVDKITKGSNVFTEHYSAVRADVPQPNDPTTQLNTNFIRTLEEADTVVFAGEAATHCLKNSLSDIVENFSDPSMIKKVVLLEDGTSCIPGFEKEYKSFVDQMKSRGMQTSTTKEFLT